MTAKQLKNSILKEAVQGKLIKQNKEDEPASELLKRIKTERDKLIKAGKIKPNKNISSIYRKGNSFYEKIGKEEICIDEELPFEIPKTWEWAKLSFVSDMFTGNSINENEKNLKYKGLSEGYFYVATKDINFDNKINYDNGVRIPKDTEKFRIAPKNSILFCVEGGSAGKKIALTDKDICFGNKLCCFISYGIDIKYLYYYLQNPIFIYSFKRNTTGIIGGVSINTLKQMFLPLPPIEEQKRIVNKLNEVMPLIDEYEKLERELNELDKKFPERLKKSILKEAFDGKLIKSSDKWKELTFSKCVNVVGIKHKIKRKNYLKNGKYPIIDQSYNFISGYSSNKNILIEIKKPVIIFGDHTRCFKFVDFDFIAGADGIKILEPKEFFNEKLFYYFCLSLNIPNRGYSRHYKFLTKTKMRIPPIEEQKRIVEKLDKLMELCEELKSG